MIFAFVVVSCKNSSTSRNMKQSFTSNHKSHPLSVDEGAEHLSFNSFYPENINFELVVSRNLKFDTFSDIQTNKKS